MTQEQITGLIRALLACLSGWLISAGYADAASAQLITGTLLAVLTGAWSIHSNAGAASTQVAGVIRTIVAAGGGYAVQKGYIDQATATQLGGAVATIAVAAWSAHSNRPGR